MNIKRTDLELLVQYVQKEKPEVIRISEENFRINFSFTDSENRNCTITLFESTANTTPELTKNMKLYTRFKETKAKKEEENE